MHFIIIIIIIISLGGAERAESGHDAPTRSPNLAGSLFAGVSVKCGPDGGGWRMADGG